MECMEKELEILRDRMVGTGMFRTAARKLCDELTAKTKDVLLERGVELDKVTVVLVLRSGVVFLESVTEVFPTSPVGVVGLRRDEETLEPVIYYENLPPLSADTSVVVFDPMLATGGTAEAVVKMLVEKGAAPESVYFTGVVGAAVGFERLTGLIPKENILLAAVDPALDKDGMIVPGLGDFGDRYFGHTDQSVLG